MKFFFLFIISALWVSAEDLEKPPYSGTAYFNSEIITDEDDTALVSLKYLGQDERKVFDRRNPMGWVLLKTHNIRVKMDDQKIEAQVNPEYTKEEAMELTERYLTYIGRLPYGLRKGAETVWIHKGDLSFGGGNNNFLIHSDAAEKCIKDGTLEEVFLHEGAHTSLDEKYKDSSRWLRAQKKDGLFISEYAQEFPNREDLAESFTVYFGYKYRKDVMTDEQIEFAEKFIKHRMEFFEKIPMKLNPFKP